MNETIPFIVHESMMARFERTIRRLWILCVIMFLAFVVSNGLWIYYESQWEVVETTEQTVTQRNNGGDISFVGGDYYGNADSSNEED